MLVNQKYVMSQIIRKLYSINKKLILPCCYQQFSIESKKRRMGVKMFNGINKTMNVSEEVWRRVHWKYVMSQVIQKLKLVNEK